MVSKKNSSTGGTVTTATAVQAEIENASASTITTAMGLQSSVTRTSTGAITNAYGLYIGDVQGTNKWSIYASDSAAPSYFSGNVGIGTISPQNKLEVIGGSIGTDNNIFQKLTNSASNVYNAAELLPWAYNSTAGNETTSWSVRTKLNGNNFLAAEFGDEIYLNGETYIDGTWTYARRGGNNNFGAWIYGTKFRGTFSSKTAVLQNDDMLNLGAEGYYSPTATNFGPYMTFQASENYTATASGGRIIFGTVANGTTTQLSRMTIEHNGNVGINTTIPAEKLVVHGGHITTSGTTPTIASCGTGASVVGTDNSFKVTIGTGTVTTCTINFGLTWNSAPKSCVFSAANSQMAGAVANPSYSPYVSAISTTQVALSAATSLANGSFYMQCN